MKHLKRYEIQMLLDGELSSKKKERVKTHLSQCGQCSELKEEIEGQIGQLKSAVSNLDPGSVQIPDLKLSERKELKPEKRYVRIPTPAFAVMVGLILVMGVAILFQNISFRNTDDKNQHNSEINYVKLQSGGTETIVPVSLDFSGYELLDRPKIIKMGGEKNENI